MANKNYKLGKLESDIERLRSDCNWNRVMDLSKQITVKGSLHENMVKFLQLESKLERSLREGVDKNHSSGSSQFPTLLTALNELTTLDLKIDHKHELALLLAKLHYSMENYEKPLSIYQQLNLPTMPTHNVSSRKLHLIGEAFAIKGLCLQRSGALPSSPQASHDLIIESFEKAGNISLHQLQERSKLIHSPLEAEAVGLSPLVEQALHRYPVLYLRKGDLQTGINKLRDLLMVIESKVLEGLRVSLAKQLAEVLLRAVCGATHLPPEQPTTPNTHSTSPHSAPPYLNSISPNFHSNSPNLPSNNSPILTSNISPILPSNNSPNLPSNNSPNLPSNNSPILTSNTSPNLPSNNSPNLPLNNSPILTSNNSPILPSNNSPILPSNNSPNLPSNTSPNIPSNNSPILHSSNSPKPLKHSGGNMFVPKEKDEEALLLILISEAIATKEVVLNRSGELSEARSHTLHKAVYIYDLLTICLANKCHYGVLTETFEKATRFSFNEHHVWYQFALSLLCDEKHSRAYLVLKECMKLKGDDATQKLLAAKLCYQHLNLIDEGIQHSLDALDICQAKPTDAQENTDNSQQCLLLSRSHLHVGIGRLLKGEGVHMMKDRGVVMKMAFGSFKSALSIDPSDHLNHFYMAYYLAIARKIPEALSRVRRSIQLRRDHAPSLHLLALLLTSQNLLPEASNLLDATLVEYPQDFGLLFSKSKLESEMGKHEAALQVNRRMLLLWKQKFHAALSESEDRGTGLMERITGDQRSLLQLQFCEMADRDSGSTRADSAAASRLEHALSEVASSMGSQVVVRPGPQHAWRLQAQIWLSLADVYMRSDKLDSARACIAEASSLGPMSHVLFYMKGQLEEALGKCKTAQQFYHSAVSINPRHVKSLIRLGVLLHRLGNDRLAEMTLRKAVNTDHMCTASWRALGQVLQSLGDEKEASECLSTALSLQTTNPILPFTVVHAHCG